MAQECRSPRYAEAELQFIHPGRLMQHDHCESFNGKFRDECLSRHYFTSVDDARRAIAAWGIQYGAAPQRY